MRDRDRDDPTGGRWHALFDDLEGQALDLDAAEFAAEVADRTRREFALLRLVDRLRPALDTPLRVGLVTGETVRVRLGRVGSDWVLAREDPGRELLIPLASLVSVTGLGQRSAAPGSEGKVAAKLDFRMAMRALARDRSGVLVSLRGGGALSGVVERVGADFLELSDPARRAREPGAARARVGPDQGTVIVPVQSVVLVRRLWPLAPG
jgi:hypothetical protein